MGGHSPRRGKNQMNDMTYEFSFHRVNSCITNYNKFAQFPIDSFGLQGVLEYFKHVYGNPPIYIHENEDSKKFNGGGLEMKHHEETMKIEVNSAIDLVGGKDEDVSNRFRSKPDEEVATLMHESRYRAWFVGHREVCHGDEPGHAYDKARHRTAGSSRNDSITGHRVGHALRWHRNGSNARGYFTWSFLDAFELLNGYESSFGLYYVDFNDPDLKRYPKLSAHWYSSFLKGGALSQGRKSHFYSL
ncbi:hypothetical protein GIB67_039424 [Kingdonia uniflora]|uniref:Beta-glucosidase n=1 Tax=Kingdonia uniflora TaxID=39325 RepID=A0A7J7LIW0_9MAGN|nr:hypothetical protein GIB67_039424 [Kingdonia uniflora]